jgi:hypothetical protein
MKTFKDLKFGFRNPVARDAVMHFDNKWGLVVQEDYIKPRKYNMHLLRRTNKGMWVGAAFNSYWCARIPAPVKGSLYGADETDVTVYMLQIQML